MCENCIYNKDGECKVMGIKAGEIISRAKAGLQYLNNKKNG